MIEIPDPGMIATHDPRDRHSAMRYSLQPARFMYRLRIPDRPFDPQSLREWCLGLLAVWVIGALVVWLAANALGIPPEWCFAAIRSRAERGEWNFAEMLEVLRWLRPIAAIAPLAWGLRLRRPPAPRSKRGRVRLRRARLRSVVRHAHASLRLPHRIVEQDYYSNHFRTGKRDFWSLLGALPSGFVVTVSAQGARPDLEVVALNSPFEPVEINDEAGCVALLQSQLADPGNVDTKSKPRPAPAASESRRILTRGQIAGLVRASVILALVAAALISRNRPCIGILILLGLMFVAAEVLTLFVRRSVYLLPGALAIVEDRSWRRQRKLQVVRRRTSAMIVYVDRKDQRTRGVLRQRGETCTVGMHSAALSAWLSTARSPTDEEIATLLG